MGIELASHVINCLLFADDILHLGKLEAELQALLNITADFATMQNLKLNSNKSKVMVIGKGIDNNKERSLGSDVLKETNEYKYLGIQFSRSLSFSYHINCYLKENFVKKYNYIIKLLGGHGSFNRISFGDALWKYIICPSIAHGCAVWIPSFNASIASLESWNYKVTKLILNTNMNIPKSALFLEQGWEPISDYLDRQKVSYFARIKKLPITRLCKLVLMEVEYSNTSSGRKYLDH